MVLSGFLVFAGAVGSWVMVLDFLTSGAERGTRLPADHRGCKVAKTGIPDGRLKPCSAPCCKWSLGLIPLVALAIAVAVRPVPGNSRRRPPGRRSGATSLPVVGTLADVVPPASSTVRAISSAALVNSTTAGTAALSCVQLREIHVGVLPAVLLGQRGQEALLFRLRAGAELDGVDRDAAGHALDLFSSRRESFGSSPSVRKKITSGWRRMASFRASSWPVPPSAVIDSMNRTARSLFARWRRPAGRACRWD